MSSRYELIQVVSSIRFGGPERYALDISRHFSASGWKVTAFTRDAKAVDSIFREYHIRLRHAPLGGAFDIPSALALARMMRRMQPEKGVVHVHHVRDAFMALLARKISGRKDVRVVLTIHSMRKGRDNRLTRRIFRNLDAMVFVSRRVAERFLSAWPEGKAPVPQERVHILHNSLYLPDFRDTLPPPDKGPLIAMYHGTIAPGKGLEYLIDALPRLKPLRLRLRIAGSGHPDYVDSLRRRAQARGVMEMIDWRKQPFPVLPLINEAHFGVLPTVSEEPFGLSNTEYMAAGRPQVCTARGAQQEYLTDGSEAFIVPPGDTSALADAMIRLASDRELLIGMGREARASFLRTLDWPRFASSLQGIYFPTSQDSPILSR